MSIQENKITSMENGIADSPVFFQVSRLKTTFHTVRGKVTAVDGVSFTVKKGEIVGIAGESGCGKSVTSQSILRLYDEKDLVHYDGEIVFNGENLLGKSENEMIQIRGNKISMIFQDSLTALNPLFTVGNQIAETVRMHQKVSKKEARKVAEDMLRLTGIPAPEERVRSYPHELSGGMRQRAMIAMALSSNPELLIADEPTTALDVTIQSQIMRLISDLNQKLDMGIILITHDLGVVAQTCHRIIIMYLGHIVEQGTVEDVFDHPMHPYTVGLLRSIPTSETKKGEKLYMINGIVPSLNEIKEGCRFFDRCPIAKENCQKNAPELKKISDTQSCRCFYSGQMV